MHIRRVGLGLAVFAICAVVVSSVAFAGVKKLSGATAQKIKILLELADDGNTTTGDPAPLHQVPAIVESHVTCGSNEGFWDCWGVSTETCPASMIIFDVDEGKTLECELSCSPSTPVNGTRDCDLVVCE